jgi:hypothetical protein
MVTIYLPRFVPIGSPKLTNPSRPSLDFDLSPVAKSETVCDIPEEHFFLSRSNLSLTFASLFGGVVK